jgi:predicted RNA-binding Zn ribbon-like protein
VDFNSHLDGAVAVAVELVNVATPGERQGRGYAVPEGDDLTRAVNDALDAGRGRRQRLTRAQARELVARSPRLRVVFEAQADDDPDRAAAALNDLMAAVGTRPLLQRHDGEPWHLHVHSRKESVVDHWLASCGFGLAVVVGSDQADRLGVCLAQACDRVYVDTSRNGRRRFCSTACQSRTKAAAYRARQAVEPADA